MPSYEKRKPSNLWSVRFRELADDGRAVNKRLSGFKTKAEAQKAYKEYLQGYTHHVIQPDEHIVLFDDLYVRYMNWQKTRVKESTFYTIKRKADKHILPYFKGMKVASISAKKILMWQSGLMNYSYRYRVVLRGHLNAMLKFGNRYFDLPNAMVKVDPIRNLEPKREMNIWTYEEFQKFISVVDDEMYNCLFRFLYVSGCRKGEALALNFDDIDTVFNTVKISKSVTKKVGDVPFAITTPKNMSSNRTIQLPSALINDLKSLRTCENDIFVFGKTRPLPFTSVTRKFEIWIEKANVKRIRIHDLRHSSASYLISRGVSVVAVSKRLGHSNIRETLNTYSHVLPADVDAILEAFSDV